MSALDDEIEEEHLRVEWGRLGREYQWITDFESAKIALKEAEKSQYRLKAEYMGWTFQDVRLVCLVDHTETTYSIEMLAEFTCVCGARESLKKAIQLPSVVEEFDPVRTLFSVGSFSPEHLREDGFSETFIREVASLQLIWEMYFLTHQRPPDFSRREVIRTSVAGKRDLARSEKIQREVEQVIRRLSSQPHLMDEFISLFGYDSIRRQGFHSNDP